MAKASGKLTAIKGCGSEIVESVHYITLKDDGAAAINSSVGILDVDIISGLTINDAGIGRIQTKGATGLITGIIDAHLFDWSPITYLVADQTDADTVVVPVGELFNYTVVNNSTLDRLDEVALLSLLDVPAMGKSI